VKEGKKALGSGLEKIIASFKVFSSFGAIIYQKIEKSFTKKNIFSIILVANHPIATQIPDLIIF
jgi:hypothetical protein